MDDKTRVFLEQFEKRINGRFDKVEERLDDIVDTLNFAKEERNLIWQLVHRRVRPKKRKPGPLAEEARASLSRKIEEMAGDNLADILPFAAKGPEE